MLFKKLIFGGMSDTVFLWNGARNPVNVNPAAHGMLDGRAKGDE